MNEQEKGSGSSQLKSKTAKGLLWGAIGSGGLQLLNVVFGIILSRILTPQDYGIIGALTIFSAMAAIFTESGFTLAIVNKREVTDDDYNAVFWFNLCAGLFFYLVLFFLAPFISEFYRQPEMTRLSRFLFLGFLLGGIGTTPSAYFFRNLMVKERTKVLLMAVIISGIGGVVCACCGWGYWGIAMQTVLYTGSTSIMLWIICPWRPKFSFRWPALKSLLPFSLKQLFTSLFTHINNNFFSVLLGRFYTMQETGYYTQGYKWTTMGASTIYGMINSVGQPVFRQAIDEPERLRRVFMKMLRFAAFVSFPAMFGLGIIAPQFIEITITSKWLECVPVIRILCLWGAFMPIQTLYTNLFNSLNRPDIYMWNTIIIGVLQLGCVVATYRFGLYVMLAVYTAINIGWLGVWQFLARRHVGLKFSTVIVGILPYMVISLAVMGVAEVIANPIENAWLSLLVKIAVGAGIYILVMWRGRSEVFKEIVEYIKRKHRKE